MNNTTFLDISLSRQEKQYGALWLILETLLFSRILQFLNSLLPTPLPQAEINFIFFAVNFAVTVTLLRGYLLEQLRLLQDISGGVLTTVFVGFVAYWVANFLVSSLIYAVDPAFSSINDEAVTKLANENYGLIFFGTVFLVPIAEECLFRGIVFRGIYDRSPLLAWVVSVVLFSAIHLIGYIGTGSPLHLLLCFIQFLPAGICLAAVYRLSGSLFAPILIHAVVNLIGMLLLR